MHADARRGRRARSTWNHGKISRGLQRLELAGGASGHYLPQAVIAAVHATSPNWGSTDRTTICAAYDRLVQITDSPVARANRALAIGFRDGFSGGLTALDAVVDDPRLARRAATVASIRVDLLRRAGQPREAALWYRRALELSGSAPAQAFLRRRLDECLAVWETPGSPVSRHRYRQLPNRPSPTRNPTKSIVRAAELFAIGINNFARRRPIATLGASNAHRNRWRNPCAQRFHER